MPFDRTHQIYIFTSKNITIHRYNHRKPQEHWYNHFHLVWFILAIDMFRSVFVRTVWWQKNIRLGRPFSYIETNRSVFFCWSWNWRRRDEVSIVIRLDKDLFYWSSRSSKRTIRRLWTSSRHVQFDCTCLIFVEMKSEVEKLRIRVDKSYICQHHISFRYSSPLRYTTNNVEQISLDADLAS